MEILDFFARMTLKFDSWPSKIVGHLFYAISSCVHHFMAISQLKLELLSRKYPILVKIGDFFVPFHLEKLIYKIEQQLGTYSMLLKTLCIIWQS